MSLLALLESYFASSYLFHAEHLLFRSLVSPAAGADSDGDAPPTNPLRIVLQFRDVREALQRVLQKQAENDENAEAELLDAAAEALKGSTLVEVARAATGASWIIKRREWLRDEDDPLLRTVVLRPLHADATNDEVKEFLTAHGVVCLSAAGEASPNAAAVHIESIQVHHRVLSNLLMSSSSSSKNLAQKEDDSKYRSTAWIVVSSVSEAEALCQKKYSFNTLLSTAASQGLTRLAKYFLPKVSIVSAKKYQEQQEDTERQKGNEQLKRNIIRAQAALQTDNNGHHKVRWAAGSTLVAQGVAAAATWSTLKSNLGEWVSTKNGIRKVAIVSNDEGKRLAYVFCQSADIAKEILTGFYETSKSRSCVCDALAAVSESAEESIVMQHGQPEGLAQRKRPRV